MAVEVCEIWWQFLIFSFSFLFSVMINFNCSITVCIPLALLEMRHSECEIGQHWVLIFLHRGTGKALLWFTSSLTLALCFPECHRSHHSVHSAIALCQHLVAMTTRSNAPKRRHRRRLVKAPRHPLSVTFLLGAISRRDGQCSFNSSKSTWALCPCPHIKHPPPPPPPPASCHQVSLATVAAATALITTSWFGFRMLNRQEQTVWNLIRVCARTAIDQICFLLVRVFDLFAPATVFLMPLTFCHRITPFTCHRPLCIQFA